jgi:hypothetical protein
MKNNKQKHVAVEDSEQDETSSQQDNETDETENGSTNIHLTEDDKEKGNLKKFNISKKL